MNRRTDLMGVAGALLLALLPLGCASDTALHDPAAASNAARPRCSAPAPISDEQRRVLQSQSIRATDEEASRLSCGGTVTPPHWVALPAEGDINVCVDSSGIVYDVTTERSTGDEVFDKLVRIEVRTWRYVPVVRNEKPTPFCHLLRLQFPDRE